MSLTAEDIQTKQFHVRFRGFDVEEVDAFLERIAENFALLQDEKRQLKEQVDKLEMTIREFQSQERTFQHAIISAQKIADEMLEKSRQESQERLAATQAEVERLRLAGQEEHAALQRQIEELRQSRETIKNEMKSYLRTYLDRLDRDEPLSPQGKGGATLATGLIAAGESPPADSHKRAAHDPDELYEKIDLPDELPADDTPLPEGKRFRTGEPELPPRQQEDEEELNRSHIPDLESDMLFSLEDPLDDDHEPKVAFDHNHDDNLGNVRVK
ncbi:MAG: DivIVA domain-containing protein [Thermodesulfobacteriota bacterium]